MERISRLLLGLEALPASLLLRFGVIIAVNKVVLNTNTAITRQVMRTARTLEAGWQHDLRGSVGTGTKGGDSSTGRVWVTGFHHVRAGSRLERFLKPTNSLFNYFYNFFFGAAVNRGY